MQADTLGFLSKLIDRLETIPDRARLPSSKPPVFGDLPDKQAFEADLAVAATAGAVRLEMGRGWGSRHIVERVALADPDALYALLGRLPLGERVASAMVRMRHALPAPHPDVEAALVAMEAAWLSLRKQQGFGLDDAEAATGFLRALDALLRRDPADARMLRTFSRQAIGDSKLVERHLHPIAAHLRASGRLPDEASDEDALAALGLERCPHPILVAGPVVAGGLDAGAVPWLGLPPETVPSWNPGSPVRSVLSIENLTSFHQHVRHAMRPGDVVVYTGGFPSRGTCAALRAVATWCPDRCFHWGDVDPHGVMIALHVARAAGTRFRPHLMEARTAVLRGSAAAPHHRALGDGTDFAAIGAFLASPDAHRMEQEELDPMEVPA